ncbi:MAG: FkbM family methyltransferase [Candidatus Omnitrophota bacterium]
MNEKTLVKILNRAHLFNWLRWIRSKAQAGNKHKIAFYRQFVSRDDLCFDIGANIGQKVEFFLKLKARVIAVEPQCSCYHFLKNIYRKNPRVTVLHEALDEQKGQKEIMLCEANAMSSFSKEWIREARKIFDYEWSGAETVVTETLDDLITRFGTPQYIKIDVEGFELNVIRGLNQKVPFLSFEVNPWSVPTLPRIVDHLAKFASPRFNFVEDPTFAHRPVHFPFREWLTREQLLDFAQKNQKSMFKDVFVKWV